MFTASHLTWAPHQPWKWSEPLTPPTMGSASYNGILSDGSAESITTTTPSPMHPLHRLFLAQGCYSRPMPAGQRMPLTQIWLEDSFLALLKLSQNCSVVIKTFPTRCYLHPFIPPPHASDLQGAGLIGISLNTARSNSNLPSSCSWGTWTNSLKLEITQYLTGKWVAMIHK